MVAHKPKITRPTVYQFKLGDFTITNILEGFIQRDDMHPILATNGTADEIEAIAKAHKLPFPEMEHQFIPTLVDTGEQLIAFDPGFGDKKPGPGLLQCAPCRCWLRPQRCRLCGRHSLSPRPYW